MPEITLSQDLRWARLQADPTCRQCGVTKTAADFPRRAVDYACNACRRDYARNAYRKRVASLAPDALAEARANTNERQNRRRAERMSAMTPDGVLFVGLAETLNGIVDGLISIGPGAYRIDRRAARAA